MLHLGEDIGRENKAIQYSIRKNIRRNNTCKAISVLYLLINTYFDDGTLKSIQFFC